MKQFQRLYNIYLVCNVRDLHSIFACIRANHKNRYVIYMHETRFIRCYAKLAKQSHCFEIDLFHAITDIFSH